MRLDNDTLFDEFYISLIWMNANTHHATPKYISIYFIHNWIVANVKWSKAESVVKIVLSLALFYESLSVSSDSIKLSENSSLFQEHFLKQ